MSFTVSNAISEMQQELSIIGQKVNDTNFMLYLNRANKYFMTGYKMPTTERLSDLLVFSGIYEYPLPSDFVGIIPPRKPYGNYSPDFYHETPRTIVRSLSGRKTGISFDRETPYLIVQDSDGGTQKIHDCSSLTSNGTWSISGDGSNLALDEQIFVQGESSLRFTITGAGGTTTLTNSTLSTPVDITDYLNIAYAFLNLQCPSTNTSALTSVRIRLGSNSANLTDYYQLTTTTRYRGGSILGGWGNIGFDISQVSTTGTPDDDNLIYIQIHITHGTTGIDGTYRLDNIFLALPTYYQLPYYSKNNIKSNGGTYQEAITATSDTVLAPTDFEEAYIYKTLELAAVEKLKNAGLANYFRDQLAPKERALKAKYPTQERLVQNFWYPRWNRF